MDKVFEIGNIDLVDLSGDTHLVTDIQKRVQEMLGHKKERQKQIRQEIAREGARALPGVLNALYVFSSQIKRREQKLLSELLAELVGKNKAAREMLIRVGVLESPFAPARGAALLALQTMGEMRPQELEQIRARAWQDVDASNYEAALTLYEPLAQRQDTQAAGELRYWAGELFDERMDVGPEFLDLALRAAPQRTYDTLVEVVGKMDRRDKGLAKVIEKKISPGAVTNLPEVLRALHELKDRSVGYSQKGVEFMFTGPIAKYLAKHPDQIKENEDLIGRDHKPLYRYWWQGLGRILSVEAAQQCFDQVTAPLDEFTWYGGIQLFFVKKYDTKFRVWASDLLKRLKEDAPDEYQDVLDAYEKIGIGVPLEEVEKGRPSRPYKSE